MRGIAQDFGRGFALAVMVGGLATLVALAVLVVIVITAAAQQPQAWAALGAYFLAMGALGGATQLPNVMERIPGTRTPYVPTRRPTALDRDVPEAS